MANNPAPVNASERRGAHAMLAEAETLARLLRLVTPRQDITGLGG
jgi:hypothetical protein